MKCYNSDLSVASTSQSRVPSNCTMNSRCLQRSKKTLCLNLGNENASNVASDDAYYLTEGDRDPQMVQMCDKDLSLSPEYQETDKILQPHINRIEQNKSNLAERNIIQVYWSVVESRIGGQEAENEMQSSESSIGSTPDQAMLPPSTACIKQGDSCHRFDQTQTSDCMKNCPGLQESQTSISLEEKNTNFLHEKEAGKEVNQSEEECRPELDRPTCAPKDARDCQRCLINNDNNFNFSERGSFNSAPVSGESNVSCHPVSGKTQCIPVNTCDTCHFGKLTRTEDLEASEDDLPCTRPECPGKQGFSEPPAINVYSPRPGQDNQAAPGDAATNGYDNYGQGAALQVPPDTCTPSEGKRKCDDQSPLVCDKCQVSTSHKLFDNEAVCHPKPGSNQCDPESSMYCIQCVQMIKPGLHHGPQSEKAKCYESYKRECVVCAAAKSGEQTPLDVALCTPYVTRIQHSGPEGVLCEECLEEAMRSQNMDETCRPKPGEIQCDLSTLSCEECRAMTTRNETQNPSLKECFPQPGMESCGEEAAKICEECLNETDNLSKAGKSIHSTLSCGPVPGQEKCDDKKAKLCQLCNPEHILSYESVFRCDPQPGDLYCSPENAQVCGCVSRWLGEKSDLSVGMNKPSQPKVDFIVCNQEPGANKCGTLNIICDECNTAPNIQETVKKAGTACGKCPMK